MNHARPAVAAILAPLGLAPMLGEPASAVPGGGSTTVVKTRRRSMRRSPVILRTRRGVPAPYDRLMNKNASTRLAAAAALALFALIGTIAGLSMTPDPTGFQLQACVTSFAIAIVLALGAIADGAPAATRRR